MVRIGVLSDTHIPEAGKELPRELFEAFRGVDLILHAGDMHVIDVLDWLESVAPVMGARGNGDDPDPYNKLRPGVPPDPRVEEAPVVEVGGVKIGVVHFFPVPGELPWMTQQQFQARYFLGPLDVVVCGHTHVAKIVENDGLLIVNPGSPTLPNNLRGVLGQVGILEISDGFVEARIVQLGDTDEHDTLRVSIQRGADAPASGEPKGRGRLHGA